MLISQSNKLVLLVVVPNLGVASFNIIGRSTPRFVSEKTANAFQSFTEGKKETRTLHKIPAKLAKDLLA